MAHKIIRNKADLAINGAPPAFEQPLHVGRPNIGDRDAFLQRVNQILDSQWLTNNGPMVQEFEQRIATHLGVKHCVAMCNGTIALEIAIRALGLGGEVIVPSWTFVATAHALYWQGITPVFADIDPTTHNLDPEAVRRMITPRTTGIIGVHLWGRAAPIDELQAIADEHGLKLMFDAAHAFGSTYKGQTIGRFGACEVLSFHATKSFNTFEGGAVVTNNDELAEAVRLMRNFGFHGYDNVIHPGTNGKMIELCAAMGLTNLDALDDVIAINMRNHAAYAEAFADTPGISVLKYDPTERNSHHYVVLEIGEGCVSTRDQIISSLQAENILARKYFWPGCHRMKPYRDLFPHADLVLGETSALAARIIVLPTGAALDSDQVSIISAVIRIVAGAGT
ncbi:MAG TPA: DegT/DnrJ/EryC1/StrS family aminotransferase [Dokdonella sp.]|uniref:DegT/DnrJ/EryC1/StrS family aminotransferase n=1 Tax=Dokdonella sp. TaxID=2291710 RepID=UPI002D80EDAF|nr:DegT/DnrJ/EryC1/StrS family aminotransferase [Dokdonella sp.]HET9034263.1 DegT/DnrJ/EryC1/StrS family aminotransferase [Dokdonella sp.]